MKKIQNERFMPRREKQIYYDIVVNDKVPNQDEEYDEVEWAIWEQTTSITIPETNNISIHVDDLKYFLEFEVGHWRNIK